MNASGVVIQTLRYDYAVPVTTLAWTQLDAVLDGNVCAVEVFDSSGQLMELGVGAAGAEQRILLIMPGGGGRYNLVLCQGQRLAIRAVDADAATGFLAINFFR